MMIKMEDLGAVIRKLLVDTCKDLDEESLKSTNMLNLASLAVDQEYAKHPDVPELIIFAEVLVQYWTMRRSMLEDIRLCVKALYIEGDDGIDQFLRHNPQRHNPQP